MNSVIATTAPVAVTNGAASLPLSIPNCLGTWVATFQAFALAPSEPRFFVASPGVAVEFH